MAERASSGPENGKAEGPWSPTFKQVTIDKGKRLMEGVRIAGSIATGNRTKDNDNIIAKCSANQKKFTTRTQESIKVLPTQEGDPP